MKAIIKFTTDSPYYKSGEKERVVDNLTEVHYSYEGVLKYDATAFESDIEGTGFTVVNHWIEEFIVTPNK